MCNFFSCIATRKGEVLFCESDSHENIIDRGKLTGEITDFVRLEYFAGELKLDERTLPEWYERSAADIEMKVKRVYDLISPAHAECEKVRAAARAEYYKIEAPAYAEYEKINAAALAEYYKIEAAAYAEYGKINVAAYAEYYKIEASAYAEYEKVRAPARAEYDKIESAAKAEYEKINIAALAEYYKIKAAAKAEYEKIKAPALVTYIDACRHIEGYVAAPANLGGDKNEK